MVICSTNLSFFGSDIFLIYFVSYFHIYILQFLKMDAWKYFVDINLMILKKLHSQHYQLPIR